MPTNFMQVPIRPHHNLRSPHIAQLPDLLPINDAIQIQAAEYWLKLGEADQALRELENLSHTWNHPAATKVRVAAIGMLRSEA
jgi:hypothetical protein